MALKLLLIGARGFIGQAVGEAFATDGWEVLGLDLAGRDRRAEAYPFPVRETDYTPDSLGGVLDAFAPQVLFQGAGSAGVGQSLREPGRDFAASVLLFQGVLEALRLTGARPHVFYPSSAAVYGEGAGDFAEDDTPAPISPYGFHKWQCELLARQYAALHGIPATVLRLFSVFGPRQRRLLVWEIYNQARNEGRILLRGSGSEVRDYLSVETLALGVLRLADLPNGGLRLVNLASGAGTRIDALARLVARHVGPDIPVEAAGRPIPGDPGRLVARTDRLSMLLGRPLPFDFSAALAACLGRWSDRG
ncbi:NAD-dependent epimerase/dehydratase [Solidesulfovibrio fructosivorans JJ]]|uniref:UDP-glucose 4-epimerase n=1 Tax=Solidesulfovibrio fructosivorans JJ] TaxID=596151 RepID=E1JXP4_SOLFR|nr:SDR family oxidoreductase [Solidesulfovibrio fructosivorans]EFL50817.1 NAD-dependent epimerase/dehydratase [Solidesulfovibrio fructosivorans JJ]]